MNSPIHTKRDELHNTVRDVFDNVLRSVDAGKALRDAVRIDDSVLSVGDTRIELGDIENVFAVAIGKAAGSMAAALDEVLGSRLNAGIISHPTFAHRQQLHGRPARF